MDTLEQQPRAEEGEMMSTDDRIARLERRLAGAQAQLSGEIVHTSAVSRLAAAVGAAVAVMAIALQIGAYKRDLDEALKTLPEVLQENRIRDRRIDDLEGRVRQLERAPAGQSGSRFGQSGDEQMATGAY